MPSTVLDAEDTTGKAKKIKVPTFTWCLYLLISWFFFHGVAYQKICVL